MSLPTPVSFPRHYAALAAALMMLAPALLEAQNANPRFGRWLLKSDAPAPASNIMTYEPFGASGMKVTIEAVNARGDTTRWWYTTEFDGRDVPVTGNAGLTHAAVRAVSPLVNEIVNKQNTRVTQRLTNVLSPDHNTIAVIYMREDTTGTTTAVTFATYLRMAAAVRSNLTSIDLTGTWQVSGVSPSGPVASTLRLTQSAASLLGDSQIDQVGSSKLTGTVSGDTVRFTFPLTMQGAPGEVRVIGILQGRDSMVGTIVLPEPMGSYPFTATRRASGPLAQP